MVKHVCIVSGANSGIGLEVTAGLREQGRDVVMACRSLEKCAAAKAELDSRRLPGSCQCAHLDLADLTSVRTFVAELERTGQQVQALINNAGVMGVHSQGAGEGNAHMLPNHYGPFLLTRLLLPLMTAHGRIVNVSSEAHRRAAFTKPQLLGGGSQDLRAAQLDQSTHNWYLDYAHSKLANLLFTAELSRRLQARGSTVTTYCVSPGRVNTNIFGGVPGLLRRPLQVLAGLFFQTPKQGAQTVLTAALAPDLGGQHALYMHGQKEAEPACVAKDAVLAADVWQSSLEVVGLTKNDDERLWPKV